jgi:hypothetical protein
MITLLISTESYSSIITSVSLYAQTLISSIKLSVNAVIKEMMSYCFIYLDF